MKMNPLVSVVMPVYNSASTVEKSIQSVLSQSYLNFELIIVDDGSTDESLNICTTFLGDQRIRLCRCNHLGASSARNEGLSAVTGDYLMFLDSDDIMASDAISTALRVIVKNDTDLCIFAWTEISENNRVDHKFSAIEQSSTVQDVYKSVIYSASSRGGGFLWNKMWKVSSLRSNDGIIHFDESVTLYEDKLWILQSLERVTSVVLINDPLYEYFVNKNSLSHAWVDKRGLLLDAYSAAVKIRIAVSLHGQEFVSEADKLCLLFLINFLFFVEISHSDSESTEEIVKLRLEFKKLRFKYLGIKPTIKYVFLFSIYLLNIK